MEAQLDPFFWRTASYVAVFVGTALVLLGSVGTWHFGNEAERAAPYRQPVRSATSTVEVLIRSDESFDNFFMDRGGYLVFGKGNQALLTTGGSQCLGKQLGGGRVIFRGVFEMDATDPAIGKPVAGLQEAEYVQINVSALLKTDKSGHSAELRLEGGSVFG